MKYLSSQFGFLFSTGETRANLTALFKYVAFLAAMVTVYAVVFHLIMVNVEGQRHSWITGLYWTSLGVDSLMSLISGGTSVMLGEGIRLFEMPVPSSLADKPLSASGIGSYTGLSVVAMNVREPDDAAYCRHRPAEARDAADAWQHRPAAAVRRPVRARRAVSV
jgi:hypothetical protein